MCVGEMGSRCSLYILQCTLVELCKEMARLIDDPRVANLLAPAGIQLSNALADTSAGFSVYALLYSSPDGCGFSHSTPESGIRATHRQVCYGRMWTSGRLPVSLLNVALAMAMIAVLTLAMASVG
jgi:hypothetical protein